MQVFDDPSAMREWTRSARASGRTVAVVPTMGALHAGHLALITHAATLADSVVVTIFVNPLQFNQRHDFETYPRPFDDDLDACRGAGVDAVYAPSVARMYPAGFDTTVEPGALARRLEGPMRPGHFRGVTTVVTKLLAATDADIAVFGQKDFQQLAIVRRLVADLDLGTRVIGAPTVREADGLAMSSRNLLLSADDRAAAPVLARALARAVDAYASGERSASEIGAIATLEIEAEPRARLEYVEVVDAATLETLNRIDGDAVILTAAWFGDVRLIDNRLLTRAT